MTRGYEPSTAYWRELRLHERTVFMHAPVLDIGRLGLIKTVHTAWLAGANEDDFEFASYMALVNRGLPYFRRRSLRMVAPKSHDNPAATDKVFGMTLGVSENSVRVRSVPAAYMDTEDGGLEPSDIPSIVPDLADLRQEVRQGLMVPSQDEYEQLLEEFKFGASEVS